MARKKRESYNDIARIVETAQARMEDEKKRMEKVMVGALLNSDNIVMLGDYSDADLRRIMSMVAADLGKYTARLDAKKQSKKDAQPVQEDTADSGSYRPDPMPNRFIDAPPQSKRLTDPRSIPQQ